MTPYYHAWINLIQQRDLFYLEIFAATITAYSWYRLWLWRVFKWCLAGGVALVVAGLLWGLSQ